MANRVQGWIKSGGYIIDSLIVKPLYIHIYDVNTETHTLITFIYAYSDDHYRNIRRAVITFRDATDSRSPIVRTSYQCRLYDSNHGSRRRGPSLSKRTMCSVR